MTDNFITGNAEVETVLYRLAARAALFVVPANKHTALVERISEFVQDRGAIGLILREYEQSGSVEKTALYYWNSRLEKLGSRFEDIITTIIISIFSSVLAGIIVEMWKGEFGPLKRLLTDMDKDRLRMLARKEPQLRRDLNDVMPFYQQKLDGAGVQDTAIAESLFRSISAGSTFSAFAATNRAAVSNDTESDLLRYAIEVSRGLIETEIQRAQTSFLLPRHMAIEGVAYSDYLAFGETIAVPNKADLGLGPDWRKKLVELLSVPQLYPEYWPSDYKLYDPSPKIIILDNRLFERFYRSDDTKIFSKCAGIITSTKAGATSHVGVTCRSLSIGGIGCTLSDEEQLSARFALFQSGRLTLYQNRPNLTNREITHLLAAMGRLKLF